MKEYWINSYAWFPAARVAMTWWTVVSCALVLNLLGCAAPLSYHAGCQDLACELAQGRSVKLVRGGFLWNQVTVDRVPDGKAESAIREDLDHCYVVYRQDARPHALALAEDKPTGPVVATEVKVAATVLLSLALSPFGPPPT